MLKKLPRYILITFLVFGLVLSFTGIALAFESGNNPGETGYNTITWTGQGAADGVLDKTICPSEDTVPAGIDPNNYLHWIFTTDGGSADADATLYLGGTGSGVYSTSKDSGGAFHFFTPYFTPDSSLTAYAEFNVLTTGRGSWILTISHGCPGDQPQDLTVNKTANPSYTRTYDWSIAKSADYDQINTADSATFNYTVDVTKNAGTDSGWQVDGTITVSNPNDFDVTANVSDGSCTVTDPVLTVPANGSASTTYSCAFDANPGSGTNVATASWEDFGSPNTSASSSAEYVFGDPTDLVNDCVTVSDPLDPESPRGFCSSGSFTYSHEYSGDPAGTCTTHDNTATITETGDTADKTVKVCVGADLTVSKTAIPTFTRTYGWDITKDVDKTVVKKIGGTATFNYTVNAWQTGFNDSDWAANGTVTVTNPNDWEAITADLSDAVDNGGICVLDTAFVTVPASSSVDVDYSCTFTSGASGKNTATATWNKDTYYTPGNSASGTADFAFVTPTSTVNKTITVTDTFRGVTTTLGTLTATDEAPFASGTFTYAYTVNVPTWNCVFYTNTATIVETGQSDSETVKVCGPIKTGALTMGFWQNKNGQGIIKDGDSTLGVCNSGTWLRGYNPFKDLSPTATCTQVAAYVTNVIKAANASGASMNAMLKAQMLATALDVYFSDPALGGNKINAPTPIGDVSIDLTKICKDLTCTAFENSSAVFGGSPKTVLEMLAHAASHSNIGGSIWYGNVKSTQELAKDAFDAINNQKVFAP